MAENSPPLSHLRARLAQPRGQRRIDALLAADQPEAAVAALSVVEVFHLVHEVGFADGRALIALATPEQVRGCLDLDSWDRAQIDVTACKPWLAALLDAGFEKIGQVWPTLDSEFAALFIQKHTHIYDLSLEETPPEDDPRPVFMTPDRFLAVQITADDEDTVHLIHHLIDDLYRVDPSGQIARHTLMAARSEPEAHLTELSYRWRSGRMADLGYVEYYAALEVFRPLDTDAVTLGEGTEDRFGAAIEGDPVAVDSLPVPVAEKLSGISFLARAMDRIAEPEELNRLEMATMVLINKVLAAARVSPGDLDALPIAAEHALSTLALGLESLTQGDLDRAEQALRTVSFTRLHRLGYSLTVKLGQLARALAPRAVTAGPPDDDLLAALTGRRPFFPRALDHINQMDQPPDADIRPIASLADVRVLAQALTRLACRVAIADALGVDLLAMAQRPEPRPSLDDHVRTALGRALLGQPLSVTPLATAEIVDLRDRVIAHGAIEPERRVRAAKQLLGFVQDANIDAQGAMPLIPALIDSWMTDLADALGTLPDNPDARFIDKVLVAERRH